MALNGQMYGANATMRQESRKQFNHTNNVVLSERMSNTGFVQHKQGHYVGQDESFNAGSSVRKSTKMDSIKAFVDANKNMQEQNYGRTQPQIEVDCSIENAEFQAHKEKFNN